MDRLYNRCKSYLDKKYYPYFHKNTSFVYIIRANDYHCKIGCAKNPIKRLIALQVSNPSELTLILCIKTKKPLKVEKYLHIRFMKQHIRGEWFNLYDIDIDYIKNKYRGSIIDHS